MEALANVDEDYFRQQQAKKSATLIFIGVTGSGKSTLIQSIMDYLDDHPYEEKVNVELDRTNFRSQTQEIKEVPLEGKGWDIKVIDTPGLADTDGKQRDIKHFDELAKFLAENASFNAVCFVLKNGSCRLTPELKYAFDKLKLLFPEYNENFFVVLSHSEEESHSEETDAVIRGLGLPSKNIFYINNIAYKEFVNPSEELEEELQLYYSENFNGIKKLLEEGSKMKPFVSDGRIWLEKRKFALLCELAEEIIKRDSTFYETAQILDMEQKIAQQLIAVSDCKIQRVVMRDYDIGEEASTHVVCLICSKFCRKVMTFEKKKEIDFSNYLVQYYKEKIKHSDLSTTAKIYRYASLIPLSIVGLVDLVYRNKCRGCSCPPVYHAKFGKIDQDEYQNKDEKDKKVKFGKKLLIQEEANIFSGSDFKAKIHQELQDLEAKRNQCQEEIQKRYEILNKLKLIGAAFVYKTTLELEMKKMPAMPDWLKDLVHANKGQEHHLKASMTLKQEFLTKFHNMESNSFTKQVQDMFQ